MLLFSFLCCCGVPGYLGQPMWTQYPASVDRAAEVADLSRRDDPASLRLARQLELGVRTENLLAEETFAEVYTDPRGKRVTVFGVTGFRFSPDGDLTEEMTRLTTQYHLREIRSMETGVRSTYQRCGVGRTEGTDVVVCAWADHGSLGAGLFTLRSVEDSSALLTELRNTIVIRS